MAAISSGVGVLVGGTVAVGFYLLPTIIGGVCRVVNIGSIFAINLLLGWTLVGWVVALAMALRTNPPYAYPQWWGPRHRRRILAGTPTHSTESPVSASTTRC